MEKKASDPPVQGAMNTPPRKRMHDGVSEHNGTPKPRKHTLGSLLASISESSIKSSETQLRGDSYICLKTSKKSLTAFPVKDRQTSNPLSTLDSSSQGIVGTILGSSIEDSLVERVIDLHDYALPLPIAEESSKIEASTLKKSVDTGSKVSIICESPKKEQVEGVLHSKLSSLLGKPVKLLPYLLYSDFIPMTNKDFAELVKLLEEHIPEVDGIKISPIDRLALTLRFLSLGESYQELQNLTGLKWNCVAKMIETVCSTILRILGPLYFQELRATKDWLEVSSGFEKIWDYPRCLGALGLRRIHRPSTSSNQPPHLTRTIDILAICDSYQQFIYTEIVVNRQGENNGGIWRESTFYKEMNMRKFPESAVLPRRPRSSIRIPYHFIGDTMFELSPRLMRPYVGSGMGSAEKIYNTKLENALSMVEKSFDLIGCRFKVFKGALNLEPQYVMAPLMSAICIHNFLLARNPETPYLHDYELEAPDYMFRPLQDTKVKHYPFAFEMRNELKFLFNQENLLTMDDI